MTLREHLDLFETGQLATLACVLEVITPKPGNVHRGADFEDVGLTEFLTAAVAIRPAFSGIGELGVGPAVLAAVQATQATAGSNTNLGTVLLLAPLAAVDRDRPLQDGVRDVLDQLDARDADFIYRAILAANPGGMGAVPENDVAGPPPSDVLEAMRQAAERDLVARQYANGFAQVFEGLDWLQSARADDRPLAQSIIHTHVRLMAAYPDSLIARKCGGEVAEESARRAQIVLTSGSPGNEAYSAALADLDFWLRSDHHRRNPGTTADLVAAIIFAGLREKILTPPFV